MPINPLVFANKVAEDFRRYLLSAFPMTDPDLARQAREILHGKTPIDMPLIKGPFVTLSEAFAMGEPVDDLAASGRLHPVLPDLIDFPQMYLHQLQTFDSVKAGRHVLISTGTGSGKTEAFLYPIIDDLLRERDDGITSGLKAIFVYPMNALANDQLDRLREMLGGTGITFGQWIGNTPSTGKSPLVDRFEGSSRNAYLAERKNRLEEARRRDRGARVLSPPEECLSEKEIRERKPRILLTNYRQLEILTTRLPDVTLFANAPLKYLVFDEAHTYDGATGAEVACLIRRVRALANKTPNEVICVGTSATLTDPEGEDNEGAAARFASRFFGVDEKLVDLIGETYVERQWPGSRYVPPTPSGDGMERLNRLLEALNEPADIEVIKSIVEDLTDTAFDPGEDWRSALYDTLIRNDYVYMCGQVLRTPQELLDAVQKVIMNTRGDNSVPDNNAAAEMMTYLTLGATAWKNGDSLLRPKVHFFIRGLDEMVVALTNDGGSTGLKLYSSLQTAREKDELKRDDAFFPALVCRDCGQHFFECQYEDLTVIRKKSSKKTELEGGNFCEDESHQDNACWTPSPEGKRIVFTNRLLEETDSDGAVKQKFTESYLCRQCGALHKYPGQTCLADGCGHKAELLPVYVIGDIITSCPSCQSLSRRIGARTIEPARPVRAVAVSDVHILAESMLNSAPEARRKLVIFSDNRQDAAFQAGWMQDHARRIRLRHLMYEIIRESDQPLSLDNIADRLQEYFRKDKKLIDTLLPELVQENADMIFGDRNIWVRVGKAIDYMVLWEFSAGVRRREVLEAMGLARVEYSGLTVDHPKVEQVANAMGISVSEAVDGISLLIDSWRRSRIIYTRHDQIYSQFHKKDDPFLTAGLMPVHEFRPTGLVLNPKSKDKAKYWRSLTNDRNNTTPLLLLKAWSNNRDCDLKQVIGNIWDLLTSDLEILTETRLYGSRNKTKPLDELWQIDADKIRVVQSNERHRCKKCQRISARSAPGNICTRRYCNGETVKELPDLEDYNVSVLNKPFTMVNAEEHTAQVPSDLRDKIEQDFKSKKGRTNCLVATPTLELGVDIGALDMVLMRNAPPLPSNYWQRAGRAGRRERMAVIMAYCRRANHDRFFFENPLNMLDGTIKAPAFNLQNPLMVEKHIRSQVLSLLLLKAAGTTAGAKEIRDITFSSFPNFIRDYLLDEDDMFVSTPPAMTSLKNLLTEHKTDLIESVHKVFSEFWPEDAAKSVDKNKIGTAIDEMSGALANAVGRIHNRLQWARRNRERLHTKKDQGLLDIESEQILRRCDYFIKGIVQRNQTTYALSVLGSESFLPGYGIYDGGIKAMARTGFSRHAGPITFELSRSKAMAIREYAPGNRIYANRGSFYVTQYHLGAETESNLKTIEVDPESGCLLPESGGSGYGQSDFLKLTAMPITDLDLALTGRITDEENLRFAMPTLVVGRYQRHSKGGKAYKIGDYEVHHLKSQGLELINVGEAGKARKRELGFLICPVCGAAKSPYVVPDEKERFIKHHLDRCGKEPIPTALSTQVEVDVIKFPKLKSPAIGANICETLRIAAASVLDMGENDLGILQIANPDNTFDFLLYDPMPGGSGLLDQILLLWTQIIETAFVVLGCREKCERVCYSCLLTYRNQYYHPILDRHIAAKLISELNQNPESYMNLEAVIDESGEIEGTPANSPESRMVNMFNEVGLPMGKLRQSVRTSIGLMTEPDWLYEDENKPSIKIAVYLDGMSRHLHGDPNQARKDNLIRQALEVDGYKVLVIQSRDLDDPEIMRLHLGRIGGGLKKD